MKLALVFLATAALLAHAQEVNIKNMHAADGTVTGGTVAECDTSKDYFPWKTPRGAQAPAAKFTVEYFNYYKVVTTTDASPKKYLLVQRGCPTPADVTADMTLQVPLKSVAVASASWFRFFEAMGERHSIKGVNGYYSTSPCMNKMFEDSKITDMSWFGWNATTSLYTGATDPSAFTSSIEAHFVDAWTGGKNGVYVGASYEPTYQAASEWVHYISTFFNKEEEVSLFSQRSRNRWICSSTNADVSVEPKVVWTDYYPTSYGATSPAGWVINQCKEGDPSYRHCELIKAARGTPVTDFTASSSPNLYDKGNGQLLGVSDADFKKFSQDADVIVIAQNYCDSFSGTGTVETCDAHWKGILGKLEGTSAHTNDQVYDIGRQADPSGGVGYFEASVMPEVLLQDMIKATSGGMTEHEMVYLRKMKSEGVGNQITCASNAAAIGCIPTQAGLASTCTNTASDPIVSTATECGAGSTVRAMPLLVALGAVVAVFFSQ
eukprot:CAMPEP_0173415996 /NCGR_PEP_ID=MMETSP1356-20130122/85164_1 /TAXON_ID=77927 ORGANISM="Hemiselmis virescens, Strain PCC157" /NCGR_SAMPLE_ID=MMETSP1356 /ASSEMBLY_ACC=CAM_ASM_000847 /LENGTH=491 /DNA_ID=CAMNT_0014378289 /DNA_START=15 /DNA_END=1490 /DNA_ORIENTATION=-